MAMLMWALLVMMFPSVPLSLAMRPSVSLLTWVSSDRGLGCLSAAMSVHWSGRVRPPHQSVLLSLELVLSEHLSLEPLLSDLSLELVLSVPLSLGQLLSVLSSELSLAPLSLGPRSHLTVHL
jgi:hypothetical protein